MHLKNALLVVFSLYGLLSPSAQGQPVPSVFQNYVQQARAFQNSLLFGKEYEAQRVFLSMDGSTTKKKYKVRIYDEKNWLIETPGEGGTVIFASNDHYLFLVEKMKIGQWKQLGIPWESGRKDFNDRFHTEFDLRNPFIALMGKALSEELRFSDGFQKVKHSHDGRHEWDFEYYDTRFKEKNWGPVQGHLEFYETPFPNIVLYEKVLKNYATELDCRFYRAIKMSPDNALEEISVTNEMKYLGTGRVCQKEEYFFKDFQTAQKRGDNFLSFYGLSEPAWAVARKPWYSSYWFFAGALVTGCGLTGFWWFKKPN